MDAVIDDVLGRVRRRGRGFGHYAMLLGSEEAPRQTLGSFVAKASGPGERVAFVARKHDGILKDVAAGHLGHGTAEVMFAEDLSRPANPAGVVRAYRRLLDSFFGSGAQRVTLVVEPFIGTSFDEQSEWARGEAVLNRAFATTSVTLVCVYDERALPASQLPASVRVQIAHAHPCLVTRDGLHDSDEYLDPDQIFSDLSPVRLPVEDSEPSLDLPIDRSLGIPRDAVSQAVAPAHLSAERVRDLVVAFNEVATNAVVHGHGRARVRMWVQKDIAVCTVSDEGTAFRDQLAGYAPPATRMDDSGMGLWLARQLCDRVDIIPRPRGLDVRLVVCG